MGLKGDNNSLIYIELPRAKVLQTSVKFCLSDKLPKFFGRESWNVSLQKLLSSKALEMAEWFGFHKGYKSEGETGIIVNVPVQKLASYSNFGETLQMAQEINCSFRRWNIWELLPHISKPPLLRHMKRELQESDKRGKSTHKLQYLSNGSNQTTFNWEMPCLWQKRTKSWPL